MSNSNHQRRQSKGRQKPRLVAPALAKQWREDNTMRITGYTFEADLHCVECTLARHNRKPFHLRPKDWPDYIPGKDENGLPYAAQDREGNLVHPVFSTDEMSGNHCGDCGCEVDCNVVENT